MQAPYQLVELQNHIERLITDPEGLEIALWKEQHEQIDYLNHQTPLNSFIGLNIYAEGYFIRLASHLKKCFARVFSEMGETEFHQAAAHYYAQFPSKHPQIQESGRSFPLFLKQFAAEKPWLFELAQYEQFMFECLRINEAKIEDYTPLHQIQIEPQQVLFMNPSIKYFRLNWSILDQAINTKLAEPYVGMLIWKHQHQVQKTLIKHREYELLEILQKGLSIEQTCERWHQTISAAVSNPTDELTLEIQNYFLKWSQRGVILGIDKPFRDDTPNTVEV